MNTIKEEDKHEWIICGMQEDDPRCLHTVQELEKYINEIGFIPYFKNEITGYSVEERTMADFWWSGDVLRDPWEWRGLIARDTDIAYGKFFGKKAGFISKKWLPVFCNFRRNGFDFFSLWEEGSASSRSKKIMDLFEENIELYSSEVKKLGGFGKGGEKNFEGTAAELQKMLYICIRDFRRRKNKQGEEYGWATAIYSTPEHMWGHDFISDGYKEDVQVSAKRITDHVRELFPDVTEKQLKHVIL